MLRERGEALVNSFERFSVAGTSKGMESLETLDWFMEFYFLFFIKSSLMTLLTQLE